tara:strand:- start:856 stop:1128 length:273 start_codon:yes stop_codon:yes gene_type:complete
MNNVPESSRTCNGAASRFLFVTFILNLSSFFSSLKNNDSVPCPVNNFISYLYVGAEGVLRFTGVLLAGVCLEAVPVDLRGICFLRAYILL